MGKEYKIIAGFKGMVSNLRIIAGVVTYNPDCERFQDCIKAILAQIAHIYVFDNGSKNIEQIETVLSQYGNCVTLYKNKKNAGIAFALAKIMDYAFDKKYEWVLTMDQDSILQCGVIKEYLSAIKKCTNAGMFTCLIKDRNYSDEKYEQQKEFVREVKYCITSGALTNVKAYRETQGYDESFFIDCVDFDICYSLREIDYKIFRINYVGLLHEVGRGENKNFLWKRIVIYHEKPLRIYYLTRNTKRMYKKHKNFSLLQMIKKELSILLRILLYEDNRTDKIKMFVKGIKDK